MKILALLLCFFGSSVLAAQVEKQARIRPFTVPADIYENIVLVPVEIHSQRLSFVLDTASASSLIDTAVGRSLGLKLHKEDKSEHTDLIKFTVGGDPFESRLGVMDLSPISRAEGRQLDGILGLDFFRQNVVEIDYDSGIVRLYDPEKFDYRGEGQSVPLDIKRGLPFVSTFLKMPGKDEIPRSYLVDTGSGGSISDDMFKELARPAIGPDLGRAEYLKIGPFNFPGANGTSGSQVIGGEIWHRFNIIVSILKAQMILTPNRHFNDALLFDASGLEFEDDGTGLRVDNVYKGSPAEEAGLKPGDLILEIDGQPARALTADRVWKMFHYVREFSLLARRGDQTVNLILKLRHML